jgi:RsiW-degrading membrane proteinase PrsW (M82 family)
MLWDMMIKFLKSWFSYPGIEWYLILLGIGLAIAFGVIWLLGFMPPIIKKPWLWLVAVVAAFLTMLAITFVQIPLQYWTGLGLQHFWDQNTLMNWFLLTGLPSVLISGLVQEAAKMVPIYFWWWRSDKKLDPKMGLMIGAIAGAGFGIFEAFWVNSQVFMAGWTWGAVSQNAWQGLLPFWERFWTIAGHIGMSALVGYGIAKGKAWQFYLLAAVFHSALNYFVLPLTKGMLTVNQVEIIIAIGAVLVMLAALWLRWRKDKEGPNLGQTDPALQIDSVGPDKPGLE